MSIHEQITALLDGELVEAGAVDELLHVLAVSPEKRALLVEQLALKRRFAASAAAVVPPAHADLAIMRGLAAVDAAIIGGGAAGAVIGSPAPAPIGPTMLGGLRGMVLGGILLLLAGLGAGWLLRGDGTYEVASSSATPATIVRIDDAAIMAARDSIGMLTRQVGSLETSVRDAQSRLAAAMRGTAGMTGTTGTRSLAATATSRGAERLTRATASASASTTASAASDRDDARSESTAARTSDGRADVRTTRLRASETLAASDESRRVSSPRAVERGSEPFAAIASVSDDRLGLSAAFRNYARLSLPRVYGLSVPGTILLDRELMLSYELGGEGEGVFSRLRAGLAVGRTQFSMVLHSNTGGAAVDTITELSPQGEYVRGFLAPEIVRADKWSSHLEVGGGYYVGGGFGTVGLNLECRVGDDWAVQAGGSTWLLWTRYNDAIDLSTNLNAHLGISYGF